MELVNWATGVPLNPSQNEAHRIGPPPLSCETLGRGCLEEETISKRGGEVLRYILLIGAAFNVSGGLAMP